MMVPERERKTSGCGVRNSPGFKVRLPAGFHLLLGSSSLIIRVLVVSEPTVYYVLRSTAVILIMHYLILRHSTYFQEQVTFNDDTVTEINRRQSTSTDAD